jgi:hypothetical protein
MRASFHSGAPLREVLLGCLTFSGALIWMATLPVRLAT